MKDLLNVLYDHYNAQLPLGTVMPYGWTIVEVNYAVEVNDDGELTGIYALGATSDADEVEDKAKTKAKGKDTPYQKFTVPVRRTRTSGAYPYLFAMPRIICLALRNAMVKVRLALSTITVR